MESCRLSSLIASSLISCLYVGSLYCWPNPRYRDDPKTIKRRFFSVFVTTIISSLVLIVFNKDYSASSVASSIGLISDRNQNWIQLIFDSILLPLLQTCVLFLGPIFVFLSQLNELSFDINSAKNWFNLIVVRNYVVAPITEEYIFRAVLTALLINCWPLTATLLISSLEFGFAHSHHYIFETDPLRRVSGWAALEQMVYTSLFGMYASLLYFKSGLIITPILVHSFCNLMGLPDMQTINFSRFSLILTLFGLLSWILFVIYIYINL